MLYTHMYYIFRHLKSAQFTEVISTKFPVTTSQLFIMRPNLASSKITSSVLDKNSNFSLKGRLLISNHPFQTFGKMDCLSEFLKRVLKVSSAFQQFRKNGVAQTTRVGLGITVISHSSPCLLQLDYHSFHALE